MGGESSSVQGSQVNSTCQQAEQRSYRSCRTRQTALVRLCEAVVLAGAVQVGRLGANVPRPSTVDQGLLIRSRPDKVNTW